MKNAFSDIYWIGGSPCAGKSTIADRLAEAHGFQVYRCDEAFYRHQTLITPERQPVFSRLRHASCDEVWMRPVARQIEEEIALYREEFPFTLADLAALPRDRQVIAEGAALLPELLARLAIEPHRAIWIVPTETFQRTHYGLRAWRHEVLADCTDPERAWKNWMARDAGFARAVAGQARHQRGRLLTVDDSRSLDVNLRAVESWFGLVGNDPAPAAP